MSLFKDIASEYEVSILLGGTCAKNLITSLKEDDKLFILVKE